MCTVHIDFKNGYKSFFQEYVLVPDLVTILKHN